MGYRARVAALAAAAALSISAGQAKEVRFPAAHPRISMIVPNDWSVDETSLGLELQSPQKDSLVLATLTNADRKTIDGWAQRALARMRSQGVTFDLAGAAASKVAGPTPGKPAAPTTVAGDVAAMNGDRPYTFGGSPPTIAAPPIVSDDTAAVAARAGGVDLPTVTELATGIDASAMRPSGHFLYTGASLRGQPVDVDLSFFPLGKDQRLLFEQQSGPIDARADAIMRSLRDLTQ